MLYRLFMLIFLSLVFSPMSLAHDVDFSARDINGEIFTLSDSKGKFVLLAFWATWCAPCLAELNELNNVKDDIKNFEVVALSVDEARDASKIKPFVRKSGYTFKTIYDREKRIFSQFNHTQEIPYMVLIDKKGKEIWSRSGYSHGIGDVIKKIVERLEK